MAEGAEIARAYVLVIPSLEGAQKELTKELVPAAEKSADEAGHKSGTVFAKKLAAGLASMAATVTAAATALVAGVVSSAKEVAALGDTIDKQSQKVGLSYEAYQKWDYAMQLAGTSMQACTTGLKTLTNKLDDALSGSESAAAQFERLGLSMDELAGLSREEVFAKVVAGLQNITDETEKAALANDFFGKSGQDLLPLFNMTEEELAAVMAETEQYGMIMSDEAVKDAAAFTDSMTRLDSTMQGLKTTMVSQMLPSLTLITDGFAGMAAGVDGSTDKVAEGVAGMVEQVTEMLPQLIDLATALFPQIVEVITENFPEILASVTEAIGTIIEFLAEPETIASFIDTVFLGLEAILAQLPNIISRITAVLPQIITSICLTLIDHIPELILAGVDLIVSIVKDIPAIIAGIVAALPDIIGGLVEGLTSPKFLADLADAGLDLIKGLANGIKDAAKNLWNMVKEGFNGFIGKVKGFFGISSPSKLFAQYGEYLMEGMAEGIDEGQDEAQRALDASMASLVGNVTSTLNIGAEIGSGGLSGITIGTLTIQADSTDTAETIFRQIRMAAAMA